MNYRTFRRSSGLLPSALFAVTVGFLALPTAIHMVLLGALLQEGEARSAKDLDKEMKKAFLQKDLATLGDLLDEAASIQDPAIVKAILDTVLKADSPELENRAAKVLATMTDPARKAVMLHEAAKNPSTAVRIVLLEVAFNLRADASAMAVLTKAIRDPVDAVALTAIGWLRGSKDPDRACPSLIDYLAVLEKLPGQGRRYFDVRNALRALTDKSLEIAADWKNYWDSRKAGLIKPDPSGGKGQRTKVAKQGFFDIPIESNRILFIIDTSASMLKKDPVIVKKAPAKDAPAPKPRTEAKKKEVTKAKKVDDDEEGDTLLPQERERLFRVKQELIRVIQSLTDDKQFTVETFDDTIAFVDDPPRLLAATPENKKRVIEWVRAIQAKSETWTDTAFERAFAGPKDFDTIFLLSDGQPYRKKQLDHGTVLNAIKTANRFRKARIHTIGFVQAGKNLRSFLSNLAKQNDGIYNALE